jgi:hypothetical protein
MSIAAPKVPVVFRPNIPDSFSHGIMAMLLDVPGFTHPPLARFVCRGCVDDGTESDSLAPTSAASRKPGGNFRRAFRNPRRAPGKMRMDD